jgi:hypothetical protein
MHLHKFDENLDKQFGYLKKNRQHFPYTRNCPNFSILQIYRIMFFILFLSTILNNSISSHFQHDNIFNPKLTKKIVIKFNPIYSIDIEPQI